MKIIDKKRINNIDKYVKKDELNNIKFIGVEINDKVEKLAKKYGFSDELVVGEKILPPAIGPVSRFNINGKEEKDKSKKEEREILWPFHVVDWYGKDHYGIASKIMLCYCKKKVPAFMCSLCIVGVNAKKYIVTDKNFENMEIVKNSVNLILELFGICEISRENEIKASIEYRLLNWKILPKGEYPWDKMSPYIEAFLKKRKDSEVNVIRRNSEVIVSHKPEMACVGNGGFNDYIAYVFKNFTILESLEVNNATYVFKDDWKELSKLTKAEIIYGDLYQKRIIHNKNWSKEIDKLF